MMRKLFRRLLLLVPLGCALGAAESWAYTIDIANDADLIALQNAGQFTKRFGGNVRWGNSATNGDWEYAVVDAGDIPVTTPGQIAWTGNSPHDYSFSYEATSDSASLQVVDVSHVHGGAVGDWTVNAMVIRAKADSAGGDVATLADPITINFTSGGYLILNGLVGDPDANSILVVDSRLAGGFTVSGTAWLSDGKGSLPMYQFKVGETPIPIPGAVWLLGSGIAGLVGLRRRLRSD